MQTAKGLLHIAFKINGLSINTCKLHASAVKNGRYGHRLIKLWEQKKYTTEPLRVHRTGGRFPVVNRLGQVVPGRIWTSKIGGGMDRVFHWVDNKRLTQEDVEKGNVYHERILKIIEDDNRSAHIALVAGPFNKRWIHATTEMQVGELIKNSAQPEKLGVELKSGDAYPLKHIPVKTKVCAVEKFEGGGTFIARSAGAYCTIANHLENGTVLIMPSGREILVSSNCVAVIGQISNVAHKDFNWGNAQQRRYFGVRPCSGFKQRKDGRNGRKAHPKRPMTIAVKSIMGQGSFAKR